MVSVEHLFSQLAVLDPARELNVSELVTQELWPQEALVVSHRIGKVCIKLENEKSSLVTARC